MDALRRSIDADRSIGATKKAPAKTGGTRPTAKSSAKKSGISHRKPTREAG
jgi:hypothetical protein